MSNRLKLKSLLEGYAWERKAGKPLPTLDEVQAEYEKKLREDAQNEDFGGSYGGNKNRRWSKPSYNRGEWVDDPNDDKGGSPIKVTAWDTLVDEYNGKHGYSTSTKSDSRVYDSEIGNLSVGMEWKVSFRNNNWRYQLYKLGQLANIFRNLDELISHFKDNNGGNVVTESVITEEEYKVAGRPVKLNKNGSEKQADWSVTFEKNGKTAPYHEVASLISPRPKLQPRWWDSDGDGKPYEPGDDVKKEGVNEAGKFYRGSRYNDEPFNFKDDKTSRPTTPTPKEWDDLMDRVNNDPRFETYTGTDGYQIKDTNGPSSNLVWQLTPGRFGWSGIGRASAEYPHPRQFNDVKELIKNFYEVTGLSNPDNSDVNLGENMRRFRTKNLSEQTSIGDPDDFGLTNSNPAMKKFPTGTEFHKLINRTGQKNLKIAFIEPKNSTGLNWTPFGTDNKGHMQTVVKIEVLTDTDWQPGKLAWTNMGAPDQVYIKLDNGTKYTDFTSKNLTAMFTKAYNKYKSAPTPNTTSANI